MTNKLTNKRLRLLTMILLAAVFTLVAAITFAIDKPQSAYAYDVASADEIYYGGGEAVQTVTETFDYATKTVESFYINESFPNYYNINMDLSNSCAAVAGANIIGYYDRYFDNLIPNVTVGIMRGAEYSYYSMTRNLMQKQAVIETLFTYMRTNQSGAGASSSLYQSGLKKYVNEKGLNIAYNSVMTNGKIDLNKVKTQLQSGNPISLYMSGYAFSQLTDSGKKIDITKNLYTDNHIAVVFGYDKINYFNASGVLIKTKTYFAVATGKNIAENLYLVNDYGTLNDADAAYIY